MRPIPDHDDVTKTQKPISSSIRLGVMPPLTGLVGMYGPDISWATRIACQEVNEAGGVLGRPLELIIEDDGSLPGTAVPAAMKLIKHHRCHAIIGNLLSNSRIAVAQQVAEPLQIPYLNFSFYEGSIQSRYFFNFGALPNQQIDKMIPAMAQRYGLKMYFAGNNYEWPRGSIDAAIRALNRLDGDVVGEDYLPLNASPAEIDRLLEQVARSGADVFVPYFAGSDQVALLTRFYDKGLKHKMAVAMGHFDEVLVQQLLPDVRAGFYASNSYFMSLDTPQNDHYLKRLSQMPGVNGIWPHGNGVVTHFGEAAYLCVRAFAKAANRAGTTETEALIDALERSHVLGPQGWVQMDATTHHAYLNTFLARSKANGTFDIIERFGNTPPTIPERYRAPLKKPVAPASVHDDEPSPERIETASAPIDNAQKILSMADIAVIAVREDGTILQANPNACELFGYAHNELIGMSVHLLLPPHLRQRHVAMVQAFAQSSDMQRPMVRRSSMTGYRKDGSFFPLEASIGKFLDGDQWVLVATLRDISELKRTEEALIWRATHDELTRLPNHNLIRERLDHALQRTRRQGQNVALLFIDLDDFKLINDTHGRDIGDSLLKTVANRLLDMVRPGDTVARLTGDEFVVLCEQVEQPSMISMLAERINHVMREPIVVDDMPLYITASIGIAVGHGATHSTDDLLRSADTAMIEAKQSGRDGWHFFNTDLDAKVRQRLSITQGLRAAIDANELSLRLQPIVDADSHAIVGAEILLRWHSPNGEISPGLFIPIAEMNGAIVPIGNWVFDQVCRLEAQSRAQWGERAPAYFSVNISARQIQDPHFIADIESSVRRHAAKPERILLEITESSLMADIDSNAQTLRQLEKFGFRVAIDDFGTGYSSLAQLSRLPADVLKIDRAFVIDLAHQAESRAIVRTIMSLGRALDLKMVAEGVETREQLLELRAFGCDYIQGYLFHRPLTERCFWETYEQQLRDTPTTTEPPIFFLLYTSKASVPFDETELSTLLVKIRAANSGRGITGCLLHQDGYFMQMLEGDQDTVLQLVEKLKLDPRHSELTIVLQGRERRRLFQEWSMAFRQVGNNIVDIEFSAPRSHAISFSELAKDPRTCLIYMASFRENHHERLL